MPDEFSNLTPRELTLLARGAGDRQDRLHELVAWHIAHVVAPWVKKKITVNDILGRRSKRTPRKKVEKDGS